MDTRKKANASNEAIIKDKLTPPSKIEIQKSDLHGYGVFAIEDIAKDELIEETIFAKLSHRSKEAVMDPVLRQLLYVIPCGCETCKHAGGNLALSTGNVSVYNHGEQGERNVGFKWIPEMRIIQVIAMKNIKKGEELINTYGDVYSEDMFDGEMNV